MTDTKLQELTTLFFTTRQIIRGELPTTKESCDPNDWLYSEVLRFIDDTDGPSMHDLAKHLRVKAPSATSLVSHLASQGWIERKGTADDRRVVKLYLTSKGEHRLATYTARSTAMMHRVFSKLSIKELDTLVTILRRVQDTQSKK